MAWQGPRFNGFLPKIYAFSSLYPEIKSTFHLLPGYRPVASGVLSIFGSLGASFFKFRIVFRAGKKVRMHGR